MKNNYKLLSLILAYSLLLPTCVHAKEFERQENMARDKDWTVKFDSELDTESLGKNISITDDTGSIVENIMNINSDKKSVTLIPKHEYLPNKTYTLRINEGIKSVKGKILKESAIKNFTVAENEKVKENKNLILPIKADDVTFVTFADNYFKTIKSNGWGPPKRDDERINLVVSIVNSCTQIRESTEDEIKSIGFKKFIPLTLAMKSTMTYIHIWPLVKEVKTVNSAQGEETIKTPFMDRYILAIDKSGDINGNLKYYTVYSEALPEYLIAQINTPNYAGNYFTMTKTTNSNVSVQNQNSLIDNDKFKNGDTLIFSGIGCDRGDIDVYITDEFKGERYHILNIKPFLGEWSIEKTISNNMKTYDGKDFILEKKTYYLEIDCTDAYMYWGQKLDLS